MSMKNDNGSARSSTRQKRMAADVTAALMVNINAIMAAMAAMAASAS